MRNAGRRGLLELREHPRRRRTGGLFRHLSETSAKRRQRVPNDHATFRHRRRQNSNTTHAQHIAAFSSRQYRNRKQKQKQKQMGEEPALSRSAHTHRSAFRPAPEEVQKRETAARHSGTGTGLSYRPPRRRVRLSGSNLTGLLPGDDAAPALVKEFSRNARRTRNSAGGGTLATIRHKLTNWLWHLPTGARRD